MIQFANNIAVLIESEEDLQNIRTKMNITFKKEYNLKMNKSKVEILVYSSNEKDMPNIKLHNDTLKVAD